MEVPFHVAALIYIYSATACLAYGFKSAATYRRLKNPYSLMFAKLAFGVAAMFSLYGLPSLFYPGPHAEKGILYLVALVIFFWALNQSLKVALMAWEKKRAAQIAAFAVPAAGLIFSFIHYLQAAPVPSVDNLGLIHWNVDMPYNVVTAVLGVIITVIPAVFILWSQTKTPKAAIKKTLFSVVFFLGGIGGWGTILAKSTMGIAIAFTILFIAFSSLIALMLVDVFMKEKTQSTDAQKQVFASES